MSACFRRHWQGMLVLALSTGPGLLYALIGSTNALISRGFLLEDAFYYLTIARRFTASGVLSLDGIHSTNGFHPLQLALLLPGAWLPDLGFVRYAVALGALIHGATSLALLRFARRLLPANGAMLAAILWAASPGSRLQHLNGMETGLFLFLLILAASRYVATRDSAAASFGRWTGVGAILGAAYLARSDAAFLSITIAADIVWRWKTKAWRPLAALVAGACLVTLPWLLYSLSYHGHIIADSGPASRLLALEHGDGYWRQQAAWLADRVPPGWNAHPARWAMANFLLMGAAASLWTPPATPLLGLTFPEMFSALSGKFLLRTACPNLILGAAWALALLFVAFREARRLRVSFLAAGALLLWIVYAALPAPPWFAIRYLAPAALLGTLLFASFVTHLAGPPAIRRNAAVAFLAAWLPCTIVQHAAIHPIPMEPASYHAEALKLRLDVPPDCIVGCGQAGIVSFFSHRTVVNLDGVANRAAYEALKSRKMEAFLRDNRVDFVADWPNMLSALVWERSSRALPARAALIHSGFFQLWELDFRDAVTPK